MNYNIYIDRITTEKYNVLYEDRIICSKVSDPEYSACRWFRDQGLFGTITSYWRGKDIPCMVLNIAKCAGYTISETNRDGLRRIKYP